MSWFAKLKAGLGKTSGRITNSIGALFTGKRRLDDASLEELEEERRLCYVGMTRAKKHLWLLFAKRRFLWGERKEAVPSRFIMELPPHLVNFRSLADGYNLPDIELE